MVGSSHEYLQASPIPARRPPPDIISNAVWRYYGFNLSHRDIEHYLAEPGITVIRESIRLWCTAKRDLEYSAVLEPSVNEG